MHQFEYSDWLQKALLLASILSLLVAMYLAIPKFSKGYYLEIQGQSGEASQNQEKKNNENKMDFTEMRHWNVFGQVKNNTTKKKSVIRAPETKLDLKLLGIVHSENKNDSYVIITSGNNKQKLYRIGDSVPGNARIKQISAAGVTLERAGRYESLKLSKDKRKIPLSRLN